MDIAVSITNLRIDTVFNCTSAQKKNNIQKVHNFNFEGEIMNSLNDH